MSVRRKLLIAMALLIALAAGSLAFAISHDAPCAAAPALPAGTVPMRAIVQRCYGSTDVLRLERVQKPTPADDEVLVKVHAASVNPLDWHYMTGTPYVMRLSSGFGAPNESTVGVDFAGIVEAVGSKVRRFEPGDRVFGGRSGALAEYLTIRESRALAEIPSNLGFGEAAAIPIAAVTALQGLRDKGRLRPGQKVLINGASGGVGTFAVQIAKSLGAEVTGVCSGRNAAMVRSIGADRVIDYTREDFTQGAQRYDLILDNVGNHSVRDTLRALQPDGILVRVGGPKKDPWLGPLWRSIESALVSPFVEQELAGLYADLNQEDVEFLAGLAQSGKLRPAIDRRYRLQQTPDAISYLETGRARGKVIIEVAPPSR